MISAELKTWTIIQQRIIKQNEEKRQLPVTNGLLQYINVRIVRIARKSRSASRGTTAKHH